MAKQQVLEELGRDGGAIDCNKGRFGTPTVAIDRARHDFLAGAGLAGDQSTYPYTLDGKHPSMGDALETFSILGVVAGATERLRLVTSVLELPYRNPVVTAKMAASLDVLSGGRLTLGVGAGWLKEEFEALNSPAFNARGAVTDEWITIFKQLWSQSPASFNGRFYRYSDIRCEPFPVQKPHPPIWVGGHSRAALRRTARHGDGWHPVGAVAASPLPPQEMCAHLDTLKQLTEAEGRDFSALTISYKAPLYDNGIASPDDHWDWPQCMPSARRSALRPRLWATTPDELEAALRGRSLRQRGEMARRHPRDGAQQAKSWSEATIYTRLDAEYWPSWLAAVPYRNDTAED